MRINLVVAASTNNVIGVDGQLPWRLPDDLRRFKQITLGHPIVMGRLTWESIGRPLPGRQNIVLTRNTDYDTAGCDVVTSPDAAVSVAGDAGELMVIGGGHVYREFLPRADRIFLTRVHAEITGDAHFPALTAGEWRELSVESHPAGDGKSHAYDFIVLERV